MKRYTARDFAPALLGDVVPGEVYMEVGVEYPMLATDDVNFPFVSLDSGVLYSSADFDVDAKFRPVDASFVTEDDD